jgi:hypothetical protein
VIKAYERATVLDRTYAEAFTEIGYYYDVIDVDLEKSEAAFRRAVELGADEQAYAGLARVLIERGGVKEEVLEFLRKSPYMETPMVKEIYWEIEEGMWRPLR